MFVREFHGTETVSLTAGPDTVFDLLVDVDRLPEWNAAVTRVVEHPGRPLAPDVEWVVEIGAMGGHWKSRARALVVDRATRRFEHRSKTDTPNPSYALWAWQVDEAGAGSRLSVTYAVHPLTFWRRLLLARLRRPSLASEVRASLAGLDAYLAARSPIS